MNELIKINYDTEQPTVSARDLHNGLKIRSKFTTWFDRMAEYGFKEGTDFFTKWSDSKNGNAVNFEKSSQYMSSKGYVMEADITVDMAKQICMIQRTPQGKQYRQYFLDLEKAWDTPEQIMARALKFAVSSIDSLKERCGFLGGQVVEQQKVIEELQPKASYYDMVLQCKDLIATTVIVKDYGMSAKKFNAMLHDMGVQYKQGDTWVLYAKYQGNGYLKPKTCNYADMNGIQHSREHAYWTQKGRLFLYDFLKQEGILPVMEKEEKKDE